MNLTPLPEGTKYHDKVAILDYQGMRQVDATLLDADVVYTTGAAISRIFRKASDMLFSDDVLREELGLSKNNCRRRNVTTEIVMAVGDYMQQQGERHGDRRAIALARSVAQYRMALQGEIHIVDLHEEGTLETRAKEARQWVKPFYSVLPASVALEFKKNGTNDAEKMYQDRLTQRGHWQHLTRDDRQYLFSRLRTELGRRQTTRLFKRELEVAVATAATVPSRESRIYTLRSTGVKDMLLFVARELEVEPQICFTLRHNQ